MTVNESKKGAEPTRLSSLFDEYIDEEATNTVDVDDISQPASVEKEQNVVTFERVCSIPSVNLPTVVEEKPNQKKVNVTVTVVSVAGVHIQDYSKSKKGFMSKKTNSRSREKSSPSITTTITASLFSSAKKGVTKNDTLHVASLPVQTSDKAASSCNIINWSEQDEASTSYCFQQEWLGEELGHKNTNKSVTKTCTVHLAITRSGQMFNLGRAEVLGDRVGEYVVDIPIVDVIPSTAKQSRFVKGNKVKMMKVKGSSFKYGLSSNATLKAKVRVSEPFYDDSATELVAPSFRKYALPPSSVGSIRKSFSTSTGYYTNSTGTMSGESSQSSLDWGIEVQYNVAPTAPIQMLSLQTASSLSEETLYSYSTVGSELSSLGEGKQDKKFNWRHVFMCNFQVCGVMKEECADIQQSISLPMDTFDEEDEPSRSSSYVPW